MDYKLKCDYSIEYTSLILLLDFCLEGIQKDHDACISLTLILSMKHPHGHGDTGFNLKNTSVCVGVRHDTESVRAIVVLTQIICRDHMIGGPLVKL